jgi:hypothetical protein
MEKPVDKVFQATLSDAGKQTSVSLVMTGS